MFDISTSNTFHGHVGVCNRERKKNYALPEARMNSLRIIYIQFNVYISGHKQSGQ